MTSFEATKFVINITDDDIPFLFTIPSHWQTKSAKRTIKKLNEVLELRSQNSVELHVKEVRKRGNQTKMENNEYKLSDFDNKKKRHT